MENLPTAKFRTHQIYAPSPVNFLLLLLFFYVESCNQVVVEEFVLYIAEKCGY